MSAFEDEEVGDAHDPELSGEFAVGIHIDFVNFRFAFHFGSNFFNGWSDCDAGSAPGGPEVDEDGDIGLQDFFFEVSGVKGKVCGHDNSLYVGQSPCELWYTLRARGKLVRKSVTVWGRLDVYRKVYRQY